MGVAICKPSMPLDMAEQQDPNMNVKTDTHDLDIPPDKLSARVQWPRVIRNVKTQVAISTAIDRMLQREKDEDENRVKILLLGGADAGKSTILKQMRILHMNGFSEGEMQSFHKNLRRNIFQIFHEIAVGIQERIEIINDNEKSMVYRFAEGHMWFMSTKEETETEFILNFLELECVQTFMKLYPNHSSLPDNAHYYIPKLPSLLSPEYKPTPEDILQLRIPTTSVDEINFAFAAKSIRLIDVGGQRTYRKKWIHCFDGVAAVLFVASMAAYDQFLDEVEVPIKPVLQTSLFSPTYATKPSKLPNRLRDSAELFGEMLRSRFLLSAAFILFLNKKDLFTKKLSTHAISDYISGYKGESTEDASEYVKEFFLKRKSKKDKDRTIYSHYTCATDTKNVEFVFKAACDIILKKGLERGGI